MNAVACEKLLDLLHNYSVACQFSKEQLFYGNYLLQISTLYAVISKPITSLGVDFAIDAFLRTLCFSAELI